MESINEEFLYLYSNDRIKLFESSYYQKDDINIPKYDLFNSRNDFYNQRDDAIIPRDYFYNRGDYFHNPKDEIFSKKCFSDICSSYNEISSNIFDNNFINGNDINFIDNKNESNDLVYHDNVSIIIDIDSTKGKDINFVDNKNEKEENYIKNQKKLNGENENNNSTTKETASKNKPKKILGRKSKKEADSLKDNSSHGIYSEDNVLVKIQTHYLNFIIEFLNCIFPHLNYNKKLYKLDKGFKINIKKRNLNESLYGKTIGEIISNKISEKYKSIVDKINANKNIYEEIKDNPVLNKLLSQNYLIFFKKFYYNNNSYINLRDFGLNKNIIFTKKVENFNHLLKKNEKRGTHYIMIIKEYAHRNYMPGLMFMC